MRRLVEAIPDHEWSHPEALHEWWYINSHLESASGKRFGLVVSFFNDYLLFVLVDGWNLLVGSLIKSFY